MQYPARWLMDVLAACPGAQRCIRCSSLLDPLRLVDWGVRLASLEKLDHVRYHLIQDLWQEVCRRRGRMRGDQLAAGSVGGASNSLKDGLTALGLDLSAGWISGSLSKTSRATRMTEVIAVQLRTVRNVRWNVPLPLCKASTRSCSTITGPRAEVVVSAVLLTSS